MTGIKEKKKIKLSEEVKMIIYESFIFLFALAVTPIRFLFGIYPFGLAFCASCKRYSPFAFAGAYLSVVFFMKSSPAYLIALSALLGLRLAIGLIDRRERASRLLEDKKQKRSLSPTLFCENTAVRVALSSLVATGIGVFSVIKNGYLYYDIFALVFFAVIVGIFSFAYTQAFNAQVGSRVFISSLVAFGFTIVYGIRDLEIQGISLAIIISYALVIYVAKNASFSEGAIVGLVLGIAQSTLYASIFGVCGLIVGLIWHVSPYLAITSSFIVGMGYAIFSSGYEAIVYLAPELLAVSLLLYPLLRFELIPSPTLLTKKSHVTRQAPASLLDEEKGQLFKNKVLMLASSFEEISKIFDEASIRVKSPDRQSYGELCLEVCESHCYSCPKETICWQRDISTTEANIKRLGDKMFSVGTVSKGDCEDKFVYRCPNIEKIIEEINQKNKAILTQGVKNDKLDISSQDYLLSGKILSLLTKNLDKELSIDKGMLDKTVRVFNKIGLLCRDVSVFGTNKKTILASDVDTQKSACSARELKDELEKSLKIKLSEPKYYSRADSVIMEITSSPSFTAKSAYLSSPMDENGQNGDTVSIFTCGDSKQYLLICDGMGTGGEAEFTSQVCSKFLKSILCATSDTETALSMLNNFIRAKNIECSSTIDLLEIDLFSIEARFVKCGAAVSFVKRGDKVYKLQSKTAPIGIMKAVDAEELSFSLAKNDISVMVSDGIVSTKGDCEWLMRLLSSYEGENMDELCKLILKEARRVNKNKDDQTVLCTLIK